MNTSPWLHFSRRLEKESDVLDRIRHKVPFHKLFSDHPRLRDLLQGRKLGHAVHPAIVQIPIGTLLSSLLSDAVGEFSAADKLLIASLVGFAPSAITGWAEWVGADDRSQRVGLVHAGINAGGVWLIAMSLLARYRHHRTPGIALAGLAAAVWGVGGYLGGHISLGRKYASHAEGDTSGADHGSYSA